MRLHPALLLAVACLLATTMLAVATALLGHGAPV